MCNRVMIAGTGSGCGKTTVTCALLAALASMGKDVISFKCGPDYIDPMFHKKATGVESRNLDLFLMGEERVKYGVERHAASMDIAVLEGVMGIYDGLGHGSYASSNHISIVTNTPTVLVVNVNGIAFSICAIIKGFMELEKNNIRGIILNNASEAMYRYYKQMIEERLDIKVIGFLPHLPKVNIASRHLGLVTADEIADIKEKINTLKEYALKCIDIEALLGMAEKAEPFVHARDNMLQVKKDIVAKVYVTHDEAFSFWYEDNHDLLRAMGAAIGFFSPIHDNALPDDADGIVLWGGYPELYAKELEGNESMKASLKSALDGGVPVYAECGGFMYLQQSLTDLNGEKYGMLGALPGNVWMTKRLQNFGYHELEAQSDNLLCSTGGKINAHFFHHSVSDGEGDCFTAKRPGGKSFPCIVSQGNILAGYQHLHFWGNPDFAANFITACVNYRLAKDASHSI